jgi:hypothetical protein
MRPAVKAALDAWFDEETCERSRIGDALTATELD